MTATTSPNYESVHPRLRLAEGFPRLPARGARARPARHHRAGHQPHVGSASVVPGGAARTGGLVEARLLRLERHHRTLRGRPHHLHRQRTLELDLGPGGQRLLLASLLPSPARSQLRQSARPAGGPQVMKFWFDMGVDGLRLDAVPYLFEREGTSCENLPETHEFLKEIRAELDARYPDRMLLAEANQWPADVRAYFGDGDECHMAFHFPLMPRMFMALVQEDRYPIVDILRQTPDIPEPCQWALFLRNHDELTLEMVTAHERDYMYRAYAADPQMRLNVGIRRRLAPLVENNRDRIELLYGLLLSMPGTPILYYGDEIGMGDNIYLGDRNGVRTPMQWTGDRNGGFSRADPARLYRAAGDGSRLRLSGHQRRVAGAFAVLAPQLGAPDHRRPPTASRLRPRHPRSRQRLESRRPRLRPAARRRDRARRRQPVAGGAAGGAAARTIQRARAGGDARSHVVSTHRRAALFPVDGPVRLLLVQAAAVGGPGDVGAIWRVPPWRRRARRGRRCSPAATGKRSSPERFGGSSSATICCPISSSSAGSRARRACRWRRASPTGVCSRRGSSRRSCCSSMSRIRTAAVDRLFVPVSLASGDGAEAIEAGAPDRVLARISGAREGIIHDLIETEAVRLVTAAMLDGRGVALHGPAAQKAVAPRSDSRVRLRHRRTSLKVSTARRRAEQHVVHRRR